MTKPSSLSSRWAVRFLRCGAVSSLCGAAILCLNCTAFNPAFVDVVVGSGGAALENAPGHVVVAFVNNATVNERVIAYLESEAGGGLELTPAQKRSLRPLIRLSLGVAYTDGSQQRLDFIQGSRELVSPLFANQVQFDLDDPDSTNNVLVCDVAVADVLEQIGIEVFLPVPVAEFEFVEPTEAQPGFFRLAEVLPPNFIQLQPDFLDGNGNIVRANFSIENGPSPVVNPICGSVITITVNGELSVPFFDAAVAGEVPSYVDDNLNEAASVGGRYSFSVSVR